MYLKSRVRNLEKKAGQNDSYAFISACTQEEAEKKLKKYWEENPDGPVPIVCVVKHIEKKAEKEDKIATSIPEPELDAKIEKLLTQLSSCASREGDNCIMITI